MAETGLAEFRATYQALIITACEWRAMQANPAVLAEQVFARLRDRPEPPDLRLAYRMIQRVVANAYVEDARRRPLSEMLTGPRRTPPTHLSPKDQRAVELRGLIARLRHRDREILQLAYWDELSQSEIESVLRLDGAAVAARLERAKARFAALVRRRADHPSDETDVASVLANAKPGVHTRWQADRPGGLDYNKN